ncbi:hypothetical protein [Schlesneria sp. T3-172]|uniref:hypothetical protein n=1 Tax=Schlesneria sphaerica TaxID=3373610 RepID=UPI0037C8E137
MAEYAITDYQFEAVTRDQEGELAALLEFRVADAQSSDYLKNVWEKLSNSLRNHYKFHSNDGNCPSWVNWKPYDWSKQNCPARQKFVAWHEGVVAGFLNLQPNFPSQFSPGKNVIYMEHIAAFPGFHSTHLWHRKLSHIGIPMLGYATLQSALQGFSGVIGLHVDGGAMKFYERLPQILGFPVFHTVKYGVSAPPPRVEQAKTQVYLETMVEAAEKLLEIHRV